MKRKFFTTLGILVVLLVSLVGTVAAQSGSGPETTPTVAPTATVAPTTTVTTQTTAGTKFFTHPVVKLLDAYFGEKPEADTDVTATPSQTPDPSVTATPGATTDETAVDESGLTPTGEQIAAFHEDGMGFGVLVKIYAMVKASEDACKTQAGTETTTTTDATVPADGTTATDGTKVEACTPLTADELVAEFKGGSGMGTLFKEYGKPALLGVGHVKHEMKDKAKDSEDTELTADDGTTTDTDVTTTDTKGQKQDKDKVKQEKNKGKSNGNGKGNKK